MRLPTEPASSAYRLHLTTRKEIVRNYNAVGNTDETRVLIDCVYDCHRHLSHNDE